MNKRSIELTPSIARISATLGIFLFHYRGLSNLPTYHLDFYSLLVFSFLSGYLVTNSNQKPLHLLSGRVLAIMLPYWFVMICVFTVNSLVNYKPISLGKIAIAFLGGNLFVKDPLYVITWYITFVLFLYIYVFLELSISKKFRYLLLLAGGCFFWFVVLAPYYFTSFYIGLKLSELLKNKSKGTIKPASLTKIVCFELQKYCYCFFLAHGGVLIFYFHFFPARTHLIFILALVSSMLLSLVIFKITDPLHKLIMGRIFKGIPIYKLEPG